MKKAAEAKAAPPKRWLRALLWGVLLAVVCELVLFTCVVVTSRTKHNPQPSDAIIVLGARIYGDARPSPALQRRLDLAYALYADGYAPAIITTGAQGADEPMPEAEAMRSYLLALGVAPQAVIAEPASYNTKENLLNAQAIMAENEMQTAIVVTSDYHLWRALAICGDIGLEATGAGSQNALTLPVRVRNCLQETLSWVKYFLTR